MRPRVLAISGSPSGTSRTRALLADIAHRLNRGGAAAELADLRDIPAAELLGQPDVGTETLRRCQQAVERANTIIVATPIYKAAYTGLLKAFLDGLAPDALGGKVVVPLATGGTLAHVLAIDYALRPVLAALGAEHITRAVFVLDRHIEPSADDGDLGHLDGDQGRTGITLHPEAEARVSALLDDIRSQLARIERTATRHVA